MDVYNSRPPDQDFSRLTSASRLVRFLLLFSRSDIERPHYPLIDGWSSSLAIPFIIAP